MKRILHTFTSLALICALLSEPLRAGPGGGDPPKQENLAVVPVVLFTIFMIVGGVIIRGIQTISEKALPPATTPPPPPVFYPIWIPVPLPPPAYPVPVLSPLTVTTNTSQFWAVPTNTLADPYGNPIRTYQITVIMTTTNLVDWRETFTLENWTSDFYTTTLTSRDGQPIQTNFFNNASAADHFIPVQLIDLTEPARFFRLK